MRRIASFVSWTVPPLGPLDMGPYIFWWTPPWKLAFLGMVINWQAWQDKVVTDLCKRKVYRGEFCFDINGSHQLLVSSHPRERDKMLLRAILAAVFGTAFCSARPRRRTSIVGFVMPLTMTVIYSGIALFSLLWNFATALRLFPCSLLVLAKLASWVIFSICGVALGRGGQ